MTQVLWPHRLNCPWRAAAATAMVRSTIPVTGATIGAVQLAARMLASSTSIAMAAKAFSPAVGQADTLYVALRISAERSRNGDNRDQEKIH